MGPGPGRDQRPLRRGARHGRPPCGDQERHARKSPGPQGKAVTFMAKWDYGLAGSFGHIHHVAVVRPTARRRCSSTRRASTACRRLMKHFMAGPARPMPARSPISSRPTSTPTSASRPAPSRRPRRSGASTTAPPGFRLCGANTKAIRVECRIGGADLNPYLAFAALIAAGLDGIEDKLDARAARSRATPMPARGCAKSPRPCARRRRCSTSRRCCAPRSATTVIDHYVHTAEWEQFEYDRRVTDWELKRGFERY